MSVVNLNSNITGAHLGGLSTDTKPTVNIPGGYVFLEFDTGNRFVFYGGTWYSLTGKSTVVGGLANNQTNLAVTANTNIITDYTAPGYQRSTLMVLANNTGILNLIVDGVLGALNSGTALIASQWYAFDVPMMLGSKYNLQYSVSATMQMKWIGGI